MSSKTRIVRRRISRGAVVVEFALCLTFITIMLFSIAQYGLVMNTVDQLTQLDREAARWAAVHYDEPAFTGSSTTTGSLKYYVLQANQGGVIADADIVFPSNYYSPLTTASTFGPGNQITVTLQYDISKKYFFKGFLPGMSNGPVTITRSATMLME